MYETNLPKFFEQNISSCKLDPCTINSKYHFKMKIIHQHLLDKSKFYKKWHEFAYHSHFHWAMFVGMAFVLSSIVLSATIYTNQSLVGASSLIFFDDYDNIREIGPVKKVGCVTNRFLTPPTPLHGKAFKSEAHNTNCIEENRGYPNYEVSENLPALVTFWLRVEAASWPKAVGKRFSPLTVKENPAAGAECDTRTLTTHILTDGTMDIGHSIMSFRSGTVKARLNQWDLHSAYLEKGSDGETHVTIWLNGKIVVQGTTGNPFIEGGVGVIHDLHAGLYGDNNDIVVYNDDFKVVSGITGGISEAALLIGGELGSTTVQTQPTLSNNNLTAEMFPACIDGLDNDDDTRTDFKMDGTGDLECECDMDEDESIQAPAECDDGIDNDADNMCDTAANGQCTDGSSPGDSGCPGVNDEVEKDKPLSNYPTLIFTADKNQIESGGSSTLTWTSTNTTGSCVASGDWSGSKSLNGNQTVNNISGTKNYILACTGAGGYRARLATVYVGTPTPTPTDTTPSVRSNGLPSGTLVAGTISTALSLTTNENATCKYATTAGTSFSSMTNTFTTTGSTSHTKVVSGLVNGATYSYYVRCQDTAGNANMSDFTISFSVASYGGGSSSFQESGGQVVMEAENYDTNTPRANHSWNLDSATTGFSGAGYMEGLPDNNTTVGGALTANPDLMYRANFANSGAFPKTYTVWVRGRSPSVNPTFGDSIHTGIDGTIPTTSDNMKGWNATSFVWSKTTSDADGLPITMVVPSAGVHTIHLWMREDGFKADKVLLTTLSTYTPTGTGPAESPRN